MNIKEFHMTLFLYGFSSADKSWATIHRYKHPEGLVLYRKPATNSMVLHYMEDHVACTTKATREFHSMLENINTHMDL